MNTLLVAISLIMLAVATGGCTSTRVRDATNHDIAVHACTENPLLRSTGLFGGRQPEVVSPGPSIRREPPPAADSLTRVLNVTEVDQLADPDAKPVIDKCGSWLKAHGEGEIGLTIRWRDRNCTDSFDDEDSVDCQSRASFRFSRKDLGIRDASERAKNPDAAIQGLLIVDAYFAQEIQPPDRNAVTGMPVPERGIMHLVVRMMRVPLTVDSEAATRQMSFVILAAEAET
jgi:hypothetical protein